MKLAMILQRMIYGHTAVSSGCRGFFFTRNDCALTKINDDFGVAATCRLLGTQGFLLFAWRLAGKHMYMFTMIACKMSTILAQVAVTAFCSTETFTKA